MGKRQKKHPSVSKKGPASRNTPRRQATDAFSNTLSRLGANQPNIMEATEYTLERLTQNYNLLNGLYRNSWIVKRIIDAIPEDMLKNWYSIETQLPPDELQKLSRIERQTQIRARMLEGLRWGRLYGGAAGLMVIDGQEDMLDEPLDLDMVMPDSFKGVIIADRWSGVFPSLDIVTDTSSPDFGLPKYYDFKADGIDDVHVHHSRILRFTGRDLPFWEEEAEVHWGASEIEHVFEELKKRDNTSYNIANLVFLANLRIYKMAGMEEIAMMDEVTASQVYATLEAQNWLMNNSAMTVLGKDDDFLNYQYTFSGLHEVYELFMMDIAGAVEMPVTKLFGRSPAGLNATGESDMQNYYDAVEEKQETYLRSVLDKLLPVMFVSTFGAIPDDLEYRFNPCRRPGEEERKNIAINVANSVNMLYTSGVISQQIALKELRESQEMTGMWNNITDEDIAAADSIPLQSIETLTPEDVDFSGILEGVKPDGLGAETQAGAAVPAEHRADNPQDTDSH